MNVDDVGLVMQRTDVRCPNRQMLGFGPVCGKRMVRVTLTEEARKQLAALGEEVNPLGDVVCVSGSCALSLSGQFRTLLRLLS